MKHSVNCCGFTIDDLHLLMVTISINNCNYLMKYCKLTSIDIYRSYAFTFFIDCRSIKLFCYLPIRFRLIMAVIVSVKINNIQIIIITLYSLLR